MYKSWDDLIHSNFSLGSPNSKGWHPLRCPVCGDRKTRAAFIFSDNGFGYNCFRGKCGFKVRVPAAKSDVDIKPSLDRLFSSVGLRNNDWDYLYYESANNIYKPLTLPEKASTLLKDPPEVKLPFGTHELLNANPNNPKTTWVIDYLFNRGIDPADQTFYVTTVPPRKGELDWRDRLIIPFYYKKKLIFYQGVWFNPKYKTKIKYLNAEAAERDSIFYNMDELDRDTDEPLFIVEGAFDANWFQNSVGTLSNTLTDQQLIRLNRCPRRKIVVPDHDKAGAKMIEHAIRENWDISIPDWTNKDIDGAVRRLGKIKVASMIMEATISKLEDKQTELEFLKLL